MISMSLFDISLFVVVVVVVGGSGGEIYSHNRSNRFLRATTDVFESESKHSEMMAIDK